MWAAGSHVRRVFTAPADANGIAQVTALCLHTERRIDGGVQINAAGVIPESRLGLPPNVAVVRSFPATNFDFQANKNVDGWTGAAQEVGEGYAGSWLLQVYVDCQPT
jgi:hypothetical protein